MDAAEISLYFDLKEDRKADLEVVAQAALHWVAAMRAAATEVAPGATVQVEFISAGEGSLRLNTVLGWLDDKVAAVQVGSGRYPNLRVLAINLGLFLGGAVISPHLDFTDGPIVSLSDEDRQLLEDIRDRTQRNPEVEAERRKLYRTLERDRAILGVGLADQYDAPPIFLVPSGEFAERSGLWVIEQDQDERTTRPVLDVILISPVLLGSARSWKFRSESLQEFGAKMKDERFLRALEQDQLRERLRFGIPMTIRLEVKEQRVDGEWKVKSRSVTEVISPSIEF